MSFGPFEFDPSGGLLYRGEREILLPHRAAGVLAAFLRRPGEVLSKDELLAEVWRDAFVGEDSLTQAISMVRHALGDDARDPTYIQTVPKRGYRFIAEVGAQHAATEAAEGDLAAGVAGGVGEGAVGEEGEPSGTGMPAGAPGSTPGAAADEPPASAPTAVRVGARLGDYEILDELGAGAMGTVYRASDRSLDREVAIKVPSQGFLSDPERVARFEREAKLLAAVSHPHIAAIHSLEEHDGVKFPVLELVEGETLAERIGRGRIPAREALELARQIACALEAAHERGIVHRDLKPANVKVTPAGQAKVLDFGLAKALEVKVFGEVSAESPTESITIAGAQRGAIVGTAAYMSPEQARGQEVDRRADIWAFGCVLYEMLTGKRAFGGETVSDTVARLLEREPDSGALPPETPRAARRVLRRCLAKDPARRLHDIADARIELEEAPAGPEEGSVAAPAPVEIPRWSRALPWAVAAIALAAASIVWLAGRSDYPTALPPRHVDIDLPRDFELRVAAPVFAPDGSSVFYNGRIPGGEWMIYQRRLDDPGEPVPVAGSERANGFFLSPDGTKLAFWTGLKLHRLSLIGGAPTFIWEIPNAQFGMVGDVWGPDDTIFTSGGSFGLYGISAADGSARLNLRLDPSEGEAMATFPELLPGGEYVLYNLWQGQLRDDESPIMIRRVAADSAHEVLIPLGAYPKYAPTGHIVYTRRGTLYAVPFDLEHRRVIGGEEPVLQGVYFNTFYGLAAFSFSRDGSLVYEPSESAGEPRRLVLVDHEGNETAVTDDRTEFITPSFSPDGDRVAVADTYGDIWIYRLAGGNKLQLATEGVNMNPVWTPDGNAVIFSSNRTGVHNLYRQAADGTADAERLTVSDHTQWAVDFSPNGQILAIEEGTPDRGTDIRLLHLGDEIESEPFVETPDDDQVPRFRPGGGWIAYRTLAQIYLKPYPGPGTAIPVARGADMLWSPDGSKLYYRTGRDVMSVDITTEPEVTVSPPTKLFEGRYSGVWGPGLDISPDGARFLAIDHPGQPRADHLRVILNWFEVLKGVGGEAGG